MKKILLLTLIVLTTLMVTTTSYAQFSFGAGLTYFVSTGKIPSGALQNNDVPSYVAQGAFVYPRYRFNVKKNSSLSAGLPISVAFSGFSSRELGNNLNATLDLPVVLDYNIGLGATEQFSEDNKIFGGFVGGGFGFTSTSGGYGYTTTAGEDKIAKFRSFGPMVHAGIRAFVANRTYFIRGAYKIGLDKLKMNTVFVTVGTSF